MSCHAAKTEEEERQCVTNKKEKLTFFLLLKLRQNGTLSKSLILSSWQPSQAYYCYYDTLPVVEEEKTGRRAKKLKIKVPLRFSSSSFYITKERNTQNKR